jgi:hypothetical protein
MTEPTQGIPAMKTVRPRLSPDTTSGIIAVAFAIGVVYLAGLILIHQLTG